MKNLIRQTIDNCKVRREDRPKQTRPTATITLPSAAHYPMIQVGTDLFDAIGKKMDSTSRQILGLCVDKRAIKRTDTASVVGPLSGWFTEEG